MTGIEVAEYIIERSGSCSGICENCDNCPANLGPGHDCRDLWNFGGNDCCVEWFKNWLKENKPKDETGYKNDDGKVQYSQIPAECLEALADVLTVGADKYTDDNWQRVPEPKKRYYDALMRHLHSWRQGQKMDESGRTHLTHVFANAMFLLWFELKEEE